MDWKFYCWLTQNHTSNQRCWTIDNFSPLLAFLVHPEVSCFAFVHGGRTKRRRCSLSYVQSCSRNRAFPFRYIGWTSDSKWWSCHSLKFKSLSNHGFNGPFPPKGFQSSPQSSKQLLPPGSDLNGDSSLCFKVRNSLLCNKELLVNSDVTSKCAAAVLPPINTT